jgi:hypothetical protein
MGDTINWGIFKRRFWGELLRHQQTSTPHYGELRWWFICPLARNDGGPPRRVAKRYLASGGKYFGSREGYDLYVMPGELLPAGWANVN